MIKYIVDKENNYLGFILNRSDSNMFYWASDCGLSNKQKLMFIDKINI